VSRPQCEPIKRHIGEPIKRHIGEPIKRHIGEPIKRHIGEPIKRHSRARTTFSAFVFRSCDGCAG
jgi:hypothetical protein